MGNHRAARGHRQHHAAGPVAAPGHRRAVHAPRTRRLLRLPAIPTIVGITALAAAGVGAVSVDAESTTPDAFLLTSHGETLTRTDAVGFVGGPRERAISRDSERQALQDAADVELEKAAEQQAAERNAALKSLGKAAEAAP